MCIDENDRCGAPGAGRSHYEMFKRQLNENINEILAKLENGAERYLVDAQTHNVVEALARGIDPIQVIDYLLKSNASLQAELLKRITHNPVSIQIPQEQVNEFLKQSNIKL